MTEAVVGKWVYCVLGQNRQYWNRELRQRGRYRPSAVGSAVVAAAGKWSVQGLVEVGCGTQPSQLPSAAARCSWPVVGGMAGAGSGCSAAGTCPIPSR